MSRISARIERGQFEAAFSDWYRFAEQRMERAALIAVDTGRKRALTRIRSEGQAAGLGRLFNGLGSDSDLVNGKGIHRSPNGGFSASGVIFIRSGSQRTRGAIESYTSGANIAPVKGRWLWIATNQIPRLTGKYRMTPELWVKNGFQAKIGPLEMIMGANGYPLLVVKNVGVSAAGKSRSARSLRTNGLPRAGQVAKDFIVAFIGIPRTSRASRIDISVIMRAAAADLPSLFYQALGRI